MATGQLSGGRLWAYVAAGVACLIAAVVLVGSALVDLLSAADDRPVLASAPTASATPSPSADPSPSVSASTSTSASPSASSRPLAGRVVALDPGHNRDNAVSEQVRQRLDGGGEQLPCDTPGSTTAGGLTESTFALRTANAAKRRLEALGAEVVLTRTSDTGAGPCFDVRAALAEQNDADVLVSLHADAQPDAQQGTVVLRPAVVPGFTEDIAEASGRLARAIATALADRGLPAADRGEDGVEARSDIGVLNRSDQPAVLVVCGNPSNPEDAERLTSGGGQEQLAAAVTDGVLAYLT